jgi:hypothetical protein
MALTSNDVQYLVSKIADLIKENEDLRRQLKSACSALLERKL